MRPILFITSFFLLLISCSTKNSSAQIDIDSNPPSKVFVNYCSEVIASTWLSDTTRLTKKQLYPELTHHPSILFESEPFYPIALHDTDIKHYFVSRGKTEGYEVFDRVKSVWGYFYFKQASDQMYPDGVVEEWTFESNQEAKKALQSFHEIKSEVFFNTGSYACTLDNRLYIFHTRAMAFCVELNSVFQDFVSRNQANI